MVKTSVFNTVNEDFIKVFFIPGIVAMLSLRLDFSISMTFTLFSMSLINNGHVFSTFLETFFDPEKIRNRNLWAAVLFAFTINAFFICFFFQYYFSLIFYFTFYHNVQQALGISLLYRKNEVKYRFLHKLTFWTLAIVPFIYFHLQKSIENPTEKFISYFSLSGLVSTASLEFIIYFLYGIYFLSAVSVLFLYFKVKSRLSIFCSLYFGFIYYLAWIFNLQALNGVIVLVLSHGLPYFFLMEKRIKGSHSVNIIQKYSYFFVSMMFLIGGIIGYYSSPIQENPSDEKKLLLFVVFLPLLIHYCLDAILWKRSDNCFQENFLK